MRNARRLLGSALLITLTAGPLAGQTASLVRDLETGEGPRGATGLFFDSFTPLAGKLFFVARPERSDFDGQLWVTDGTPQGTRLLVDPCLRLVGCFSSSGILGTAGGAVLFTTTEFPQRGVWRSDGTTAGTFRLHPRLYSSPRVPVLSFRGSLFFLGCEGGGVCGLWKTDGSVAGTVRVSLLPEGLSLRTIDILNGRLLFTATDRNETALWSSDGTADSATRIHTLAGSASVSAVTGGRLFIGTGDTLTPQLWATDGTAAGTRVVRDFAYSSAPFSGLMAAGRRLYFIARGSGSSDREVWTSDGTAAGTYNVTALDPGQFLGGGLTAVGERAVFFVSSEQHGLQLWVSEGRRAAAAPLTETCGLGCVAAITALAGRAVFLKDDGIHGSEPWITDGTPAGTRLIADLCPGPCTSTETSFQAAPGGLLFVANDGVHGRQLWRTDGTAAGTVRLTSVEANGQFLRGARVGGFVAGFLGARFLFAFESPEGVPGLWVSDPPPASHLAAVIHPQGPSSMPTDLFAAGDRLLFTRRDGSLWSSRGTPETTQVIVPAGGGFIEPARVGGQVFLRQSSSLGTGTLWRTDGTAAGTLPVPEAGSDVSEGMTEWQGKLFFGAGNEIWKSDGTPAGTVKVLDVPAVPPLEVSHLTGLGPELYFLVSWLGSDAQIWRTDGTPAGTRKLLDAGSYSSTQAVTGFTRLGEAVFFDTADGRPWRTDGTAAGTVPLNPEDAARLTVFQGALYFFTSTGNTVSLWRSDGTEAGAFYVTDVAAPVSPLVEYQGRLWFLGNDDFQSLELWSTDGTAAGTVRLSEIRPGADYLKGSELIVAGGRLFFSADDGTHGTELWQSDGTAAGTRLVQDLAPFGASSFPAQLTVAGDRLYFVASDGPSGYELWSLPLTPPGAPPVCQASSTALCLNGGRFRVEARWRDFQGNTGPGQAVALTGDTGYFWFFDPANVETVLKILDGRGTNNHFWLFFGALSSVEYLLTVTDTQTGLVRQYFNPSGQLSSIGDTNGFGPLGASKSGNARTAPPSPLPLVAERTDRAAATGSCAAGPQQLCLAGGRFAVKVGWKDFGGGTGQGTAVPLSGDTGWFWFFDAANLELMVKVLDGTGVNGKHWVFYGALSSVEYTLEVTDTQTGTIRTYRNPASRLASAADTGAF